MISSLKNFFVPMLFAMALTACGEKTDTNNNSVGSAIYYWRTKFELTDTDAELLERHNVSRIYLRMFDVAIEINPETGLQEVVPIATTRFSSEKLPKDIEIVPTVYITIDALRAMHNHEPEYTELIVERLRAMASYNNCGSISEMQFDCDWTSGTRTSYAELCREACRILHHDGINLSATIRLHQLAEEAPPVDRGVLMLYNTGALKNPNTHNSILDIEDVVPYLRNRKCKIPLDYAYPAFGWGVKFHNGKFQHIVSNPESEKLDNGDTIRIERPTADEVLAVKTLVENRLGSPSHYRIIYHLDIEQLKNYTDDEISAIYNNN